MKITMHLPNMPGRTQLLGSVELICPNCQESDIWLFGDLDSDDKRLRCNYCNFEMRYNVTEKLMELWDMLYNALHGIGD